MATNVERRGPRSKHADRGPWRPRRRPRYPLGAPEWEKEVVFDAQLALNANRTSLGEHGHKGKARALGRMGEPKDRGQKKEKALNTNDETRALETGGFDRGALKR